MTCDRRSFLLGLAGYSAAFPLLGCRSRAGQSMHIDLHGQSDDNIAVSDPRDGSPLACNDFLRQLVVARGYDPPFASRVYGYLSLAQACAATEAEPRPEHGGRARTASLVALLHGARPLFAHQLQPREHYEPLIAREAQRYSLSAAQMAHARATGMVVATRILEHMAGDGADETDDAPAPPDGASIWRTQEHRPPVRPLWGRVRPALVEPAEFELRPPPDADIAGFRAALAEVRERALRATPGEIESVRLWADAAGTSTPPGHWNRIACQLARKYGRDERGALDALALANLAMFDAGILCWRVKFTYWLARPNQMDPGIRTLLKVPNFPAYPSGHSAFSGAAAEVLAHFHPAEADTLTALADEASESRIISGLHYRFDCDEGLRIGRWVGQAAIRAWHERRRFRMRVWL